MSEHEADAESSESEIDENDPMAPQLHYIRMQKKLKKVRACPFALSNSLDIK